MNESKSKNLLVLAILISAVALLLIGISFVLPSGDNEPAAKGTTNFSDLVADSLTVDSLTVDGNTPVVGGTTLGIYAAQVQVTGTLAIAAATHGLSAITSAVCSLAEDGPSTGAGEAALCWIGTSGTTVTITAEQDDWTTNATVMTPVNVIIVGTP